MSRRSTGLVGVWAEMQRQQQRQVETEARRRRQEAQQARAFERRAVQSHREYRQAEALRRTEELDARVASLQGLLADGCRAPAFRASALLRTEEIQPFAPGSLAQPVPMPNPDQYQTQSGWTAGRRAQAQSEARTRFERDWHAAQAAEAQRQRQLASYQREYQQWVDARLADVRAHNAGVVELTERVRRHDPESVVEYFSAALYTSTAWPEEFPRQISAAYDSAARQLVLDWELPGYAVVPETKSVRYIVTNCLPRSVQPGATKAMQEIHNAEDRTHAEKAIKAFSRTYGTKWRKTVAKITDDRDELLAFYDFPAEHWVHLRTTNPIE